MFLLRFSINHHVSLYHWPVIHPVIGLRSITHPRRVLWFGTRTGINTASKVESVQDSAIRVICWTEIAFVSKNMTLLSPLRLNATMAALASSVVMSIQKSGFGVPVILPNPMPGLLRCVVLEERRLAAECCSIHALTVGLDDRISTQSLSRRPRTPTTGMIPTLIG